jgi:hypothetical protein
MTLFVWSIGGTLLLAALGWMSIVYIPQKIYSVSADIEDARVTIALNDLQRQNLSTLTTQYATIQEQSAKLSGAFLDRTQPLVFVEHMEKLATETKVEQAFVPTEPSRTRPGGNAFSLDEKAFTLSVTGPTANVLLFLRKFEADPGYAITTSISLAEVEAGNTSLQLVGTIPWH